MTTLTPAPTVTAATDPLAALLAGIALHRLSQPRVRIVRGGYRGDLGRISGAGAAGGHVITTDSGLTLYMAEHDIERITA